MRLVKVTILYNLDFHSDFNAILETKNHIEELLYWVKERPDVVHVSRVTMLPDGEHDD